ncbi:MULTISPECIES: hypothetical protein [Cytobacillus]|uniref:hypothetical protein n=1 Tax=Cytobacillus TaxID=2675230 RepID=UPI000C82CC86|nr:MULTISPECIES: hypothetical protein [Cytobacillus]
MARRVVETNAASLDRELLQVIVIYEEGVSKQDIRKENPYSKKHGVLYQAAGAYEFKGLAAN